MENQEVLTQLIYVFILAGGLGYINYFILSKLNAIFINYNNKDEKTFILILFSIINVCIFQFFERCISETWLKLLLVLLITIVLSLTIYRCIISLIYKLLNIIRIKENSAETFNKPVKKLVFEKNEVLFVYMYDLISSQLISYGTAGFQSETNDIFDLVIYPTKKAEMLSYDEAYELALDFGKASIYINVDKQIKIVVIPEPK